MADYYNVTTNTGDAEIAAAIASNNKLAITHIAFGDGNGAVTTPSKARTSLIREVHRQAVTKYERHPTNANWIVIETIIPSNIGGFWVREIGVIANGKLISHGSHAPFEKVADPTGVSEYRIKFTQNIKDGNVVNITLDQSLIYASQAWVDENYIPRNEIIDDTKTDDSKKPLSAKQGKKLQEEKVDKAFIRKTLGNTSALLAPAGYNFNDIMPGDYLFCDLSIASLNPPPFSYASVFCEGVIGDHGQRFVTARDYFTGQLAVRAKQNGIWSDWHVQAVKTDNVASATKLQTPRNIAISGDGAGSASFDGSANALINLTLKDVNNSAGTYGANNLEIPTFTLNKKGLLTSAGNREFPYAGVGQYGAAILYDGLDSYSNSHAVTANIARHLNAVKAETISISRYRQDLDATRIYSPNLQKSLNVTDSAVYTPDLIVLGKLLANNFASDSPYSFLTGNGQQQVVMTGGLLASDNYADQVKVHGLGIYAKGVIESAAGFSGKLLAKDSRIFKPSQAEKGGISSYFVTEWGLNNDYNGGNYGDFLSLNTYHDQSAGKQNGLFFDKAGKRIVHYQSDFGAVNWGYGKTLAYAEDVLSTNGGTMNAPINFNLSQADGAFHKLIEGSTSTDGGYIAVGNHGSDKGYLELGTTDDGDAAIYARKRNTSGQVLQQATILDPNGNTLFPGETSAKSLGINNVEGNGAGLSLHGGAVGGLPQYGISFAKTFNFGGHGYVTSDWATYFTTTGGNNRGWIFRSGDNGNVASIDAQGLLSIPTMKMERSNFQIEHYSTFSIYYDFATRIVRIVMKVQSAAGIGTADSPFKFVDNLYTAKFSLPITLQLRLSAEFHFNNVGPGYTPWHQEAAEWLTWCAPVGLRGSTESAVTVDIMRWVGGRGEAIDGYLIVTGFF